LPPKNKLYDATLYIGLHEKQKDRGGGNPCRMYMDTKEERKSTINSSTTAYPTDHEDDFIGEKKKSNKD